MTDPDEEDKDTKGQHSDQDLKQYKDEDVEQPMMRAAPRSVVEQEGKLQMDSLRDCLSYGSSICTIYKCVLVWHNQW